jgi:hypothetical protein
MKPRTLTLIALISLVPSLSDALRINEIGVGRFAAGKKITANTASQDLLALTTRNAITQMELLVHNKDGKGVSLGLCGFPISRTSWVTNRIHSIGWTQLTSTYTDERSQIDVLESLLTPVVWFKVKGRQLSLFQNGPLQPTPVTVKSLLAKPTSQAWVCAWVESRSEDPRHGPISP